MSKKINRFEELDVWQRATELAVMIYEISNKGKLSKDFSARDHFRKTVLSISNNIAEGFEYNSNNEFLRYLKYAKGSAGELRNQIYVIYKIGYIDQEAYEVLNNKTTELSQHIKNFMKYLKDFEKKKTNN